MNLQTYANFKSLFFMALFYKLDPFTKELLTMKFGIDHKSFFR